MSCRHRPDYRTFTSLLTRQVEEFQVATSGGVWAATGVGLRESGQCSNVSTGAGDSKTANLMDLASFKSFISAGYIYTPPKQN